MTLKSRFFFVTVTTTFAVALAVAVANRLTYDIHQSRFLTAEIGSKRSIWGNIINNELDRMEYQAFSLTRDNSMRQALLEGDVDTVRASVESTFDRLWALQLVTKLQIADKRGSILVSFPNAYEGATRKSIVSAAIIEGRVKRGIERDDNGELLAIVAIPLYAKYGQLIGVGIFGRNLIGVLQRFMEQDVSLAFIADRGGIVGLPIESNVLPDVSDMIPELGEDVYSVEFLHGRAYQVNILSIGDFRGRPLSHMAVFRDYTDSYAEERTANYTTYAIIVLMLIASAIWLYWFVVIESARLHDVDKKKNRELAITNKKLQDAIHVKSDFLASMSHELRTPLNSVIGFSGALLKGVDGELNEDQRSSIQYVHGSGQHLLNLINDVLDISKIESGKMVLNLEIVDLRNLINDSAQSVTVLFDNKRLPLRMEIADDVPMIYGDNTRIKQVLLNILSNAAKFTDRGEVVVKVDLVPVNELTIPDVEIEQGMSEVQTHWVVISVKDTGIGIKSEDLFKVFEEFRQIDSGSSRKYGGTGLGMAISRRIVEMHGGYIWLKSKVNKGTTFFVIFPHAADAGLNAEDQRVDSSLLGSNFEVMSSATGS